MSNHYRFTKNMTLLIDTDKKTIQIVGSFKFEELEEAKKIISQYENYNLDRDLLVNVKEFFDPAS